MAHINSTNSSKELHCQQSSQSNFMINAGRLDNVNNHQSFFYLPSNLNLVSVPSVKPAINLKLNIKPKFKNKSLAFSMREVEKGHKHTKSEVLATLKQKQNQMTTILQQKSPSNIKFDAEDNHHHCSFQNQTYFRKTKLNSTQNLEYNKTRNNKFFTNLQDVNFVKIDSRRVSRYRQSVSEQDREKQKWNKSLERYMDARVKMSQHFIQTKRTSGEFNNLALDKKNKVLQKKKLAELMKINISNQPKSQNGPFVSNLYGNSNNKTLLNSHQSSLSNKNKKKGQVHRCDALLVNFVGTYFRRKLYKKTRKSYAFRRAKTDYIQERSSMIGLEGQQIYDEMLVSSRKFEGNLKKSIKEFEKVQH